MDVVFLKLMPQSVALCKMEIQVETTMIAQGRESLPLHGHGFVKTAYERHQPEQTLLYQLLAAHYPTSKDQLTQQGNSLPDHVQRDFATHLKCGPLKHGFLRGPATTATSSGSGLVGFLQQSS